MRSTYTLLDWLNAFALTAVLLLAYGWRWTFKPEYREDPEANARSRMDCRALGQIRKQRRQDTHAQLARELGKEWRR